MRKGFVLAMAGVLFLAGCGKQGDKSSGIPIGPKWKGAPYRLAFDTKAAKPAATGITIPTVKYTANPEALEKRAIFVVRFDSLGDLKTPPAVNKMIMSPVDISGAEGTLPSSYMDSANKGLTTFLGAYCVKGKITLSVALARSSLSSQAGDAEVDSKRLSDWLPIEAVFKNPRPKC